MSIDEFMALADEYVAACARVSYMGFKPVTETREALRSALESAIAEERRACLKVCEMHETFGLSVAHAADAIRARSIK